MGGRGASSESSKKGEGGYRPKRTLAEIKMEKELKALHSRAAKTNKGVGETFNPSTMKGSFNVRAVDTQESKGEKISYMLVGTMNGFNMSAKEAHSLMSGSTLSDWGRKSSYLVNAATGDQYVYTAQGFRKRKTKQEYWKQAANYKGN